MDDTEYRFPGWDRVQTLLHGWQRDFLIWKDQCEEWALPLYHAGFLIWIPTPLYGWHRDSLVWIGLRFKDRSGE